jgi:hypothetical protein
VRFQLPSAARQALADFSQRAFFSFTNETYQHKSPPFTDDFRQSLLDDLLMSDRDADRHAA